MLAKQKTTNDTANMVVKIEISRIVSNPDQPRKIFEKKALLELADSIRSYGILQPISVRKLLNNKYELIAGERRVQAAKLAGMRVVPCIVAEVKREDSAMIALVENIQRQDLSFFEEAYAIEKLITQFSLTQEQIAKKLGKSQSTVANKRRLLRLSTQTKETIIKYGLTERHARALLRIPKEEDRSSILNEIVTERYGVAQTEEKIDRFLNKQEDEEREKKAKPIIGMFKDIRIFVNTINNAVNVMKTSGVKVQSEKIENNDYIEYSIRIPKNMG